MITHRRTVLPWALRAVITAAVIGGLFAMHGLAGPASSTMPAAGAHALSTSVQPMMGVASMGCGIDHAHCVAVLPPQKYQVSAGIALLPIAPVALTVLPADLCILAAPRAPPGISLTRLCISRT